MPASSYSMLKKRGRWVYNQTLIRSNNIYCGISESNPRCDNKRNWIQSIHQKPCCLGILMKDEWAYTAVKWMPNEQQLIDKFFIVCEDFLCVLINEWNSGGSKIFARILQLTRESVHFQCASTWKIISKSQIGFTKTPKFESSVHIQMQRVSTCTISSKFGELMEKSYSLLALKT